MIACSTLAAMALMIWARWHGADVRRRWHSLRTTSRLAHDPRSFVTRHSLLGHVGRVLWNRTPLRRWPLEHQRYQRVPLVVLATCTLVALRPILVLFGAGVAIVVFVVTRRARHRRFVSSVQREVPMAIDLFHLMVSAGNNITQALHTVAGQLDGPLGEALRASSMRVRNGQRMEDALERAVAMAGEGARPLVGALLTADRYGAPIEAVLQRLADEARAEQRRNAERRAQQLSVHLLFPVAGLILPAFALLTVAPLLAGSFGTLAPHFQ